MCVSWSMSTMSAEMLLPSKPGTTARANCTVVVSAGTSGTSVGLGLAAAEPLAAGLALALAAPLAAGLALAAPLAAGLAAAALEAGAALDGAAAPPPQAASTSAASVAGPNNCPNWVI